MINSPNKILITGFEAFGPHLINPSEKILNNFKGYSFIKTLVLPVSYDGCFEKLKKEIENFQPQVVICLGLSGNRSVLSLEKVAINFMDSENPDNTGLLVKESLIDPEGSVAFFSTLPLKEMVKASLFPCEISYTAGTYVCNYLFYKLMEYLNFTDIQAGFIHLPHLGKNELVIFESLLRMIELTTHKSCLLGPSYE